jgi:transcriptional regulator with XRE-family HTH domain
MPRNGNIALAVRENLALYMAARPHLRLLEIAKSCDLSYSGLSKLMATKQVVHALSTETIDKLAAGLNIPAAWLVASGGTEMANMSFTGAKRIDEWLVHWAKHLFLGDAGYKVMRDHYAEDYYTTGFDPSKFADAGYDLIKVHTMRRDGYETLGISAQDEYRANHLNDIGRFVVNSAKIINTHHVIVTYESMAMTGHQRATDAGATCLEFTRSIREIIQNVPVVGIQLQSNTVVPGTIGHITTISGAYRKDLDKGLARALQMGMDAKMDEVDE